MILIIKIYNKKFHYLEFVKPIEDIIKKNGIEFKSIHYKKLDDTLISHSEKVIISGTSLKDNTFLDDVSLFNWIKNYKKPILGICGGMHILGLIFNGKLKRQKEIGLTEINFNKYFLGQNGIKQVYELHNYLVETNQFEIVGTSKNCIQAVKYKNKPIYGVLFHPEVRTKDLIINFIRL